MSINIISPSAVALKIIEDLEIRDPSEIKVKLIAENRGATVVESLLTSSEGRLVRRGSRAKITVPLNEKNVGRKRFSIGHELGHFELHSYLTSFVACSKADMTDWKGYKGRETEANVFSAELLMPKALFEPRIIRKKPNMNLIERISEEFRTSLTATAYRYMQVTREPCALIYSVNGKIEWFIRNENDFKYYLKGRGEPVDEQSFAHDAFQGKGDVVDGDLVSASVWVGSDHPMYESIELIESTKFLKYYNATITLLWEP